MLHLFSKKYFSFGEKLDIIEGGLEGVYNGGVIWKKDMPE